MKQVIFLLLLLFSLRVGAAEATTSHTITVNGKKFVYKTVKIGNVEYIEWTKFEKIANSLKTLEEANPIVKLPVVKIVIDTSRRVYTSFEPKEISVQIGYLKKTKKLNSTDIQFKYDYNPDARVTERTGVEFSILGGARYNSIEKIATGFGGATIEWLFWKGFSLGSQVTVGTKGAINADAYIRWRF